MTKETRDNTLSVTVPGQERSFNPMHWTVLYDDVNCQYKMYLMYVFIAVDLNSVGWKKKKKWWVAEELFCVIVNKKKELN